MAVPKTLTNSPIKEVVLDIRTVLPESVDLHTLETLQDSIKEMFPLKEVNYQHEASIEMTKGKKPVIDTKSKSVGYLFKNQDKNKIVQASFDGFTFNLINSYKNSDDFFREAKEYWEKYKETTNPVQISRIALRYINRIDIPLPVQLDEYLNILPQTPESLDYSLEDFFMRLILLDTKNENRAIITQTIDRSVKLPQILPLIFDIDVFRSGNMPVDDSNLWEIINTLSEYKSSIFWEGITEKLSNLLT